MTTRGSIRNTPEEIRAILQETVNALNARDPDGRKIGDAKFGIYAFYDYDGEPIYVGQTTEKLRARVRRHLTNQRTDAVAMNVLDPFEVADIEMWPFWDFESFAADDPLTKSVLNSAEYAVYKMLIDRSTFGAILNERAIPEAPEIEMPESYRSRIVPEPVYSRRIHADVRIARRASTIAKLAEVISQRAVSHDLRATLLTQARRLEHLARRRLEVLTGGSADKTD